MTKLVVLNSLALALATPLFSHQAPVAPATPAPVAAPAPVVPAAKAQLPTVPGLYQGTTRLELSTNSGFKTKGAWKTGFTYGVAHTKGVWVYRGQHAAIQISDSKPTFTLVSLTDVSTNSIVLLRCDIQKKDREIQFVDVNVWSGANTENKNVVPVSVSRISGTNDLLITPAADLPAGEYLLITTPSTNGYSGYDFGILVNPQSAHRLPE